MVKIIVAEDEDLQRKYLINDLTNLRGNKYQVVGEARNGVELIALWKTLKPDLLIVDLNMPVLNGYQAITEIRKTDKNVSIIVLTCIDERNTIEKLYDEIDTYLLKTMETPAEVIKKIDEIITFKSPSFKKYILDILKQDKKEFKFKDYELIQDIRKGLTNQQLADKYFVSEKTIEKRLQALYKYYKVKNRFELVELMANQIG